MFNFLEWIQRYEDWPFLGPIWSISPKRKFFRKIIVIIFILTLSLGKVPTMDPELKECTIFGSKMDPFAQTDLLKENLLINLVPIIHAYIHFKNENQISRY